MQDCFPSCLGEHLGVDSRGKKKSPLPPALGGRGRHVTRSAQLLHPIMIWLKPKVGQPFSLPVSPSAQSKLSVFAIAQKRWIQRHRNVKHFHLSSPLGCRERKPLWCKHSRSSAWSAWRRVKETAPLMRDQALVSVHQGRLSLLQGKKEAIKTKQMF